MRILAIIGLFLAAMSATGAGSALADLRFSLHGEDDIPFILVEGEFSFDDDLAAFTRLAISGAATFVTFDSPGGNVIKALQLGRLIRAAGMDTVQIRELDCASACAFAFLGGVNRQAAPGAIGVHKMSFSGGFTDGQELAHSIQELTAQVMAYMREMGADPAVIELALAYDSDDIRYLSAGEMSRYRIVTNSSRSHAAPDPPPTLSTPSASAPRVAPPSEPRPAHPQRTARPSTAEIPIARSGVIRHPEGRVALRLRADAKAPPGAMLRNGTPVQILSSADQWYRVRVGRMTGYAHHSWVYADQFMRSAFDHRYIQVKSFRSFEAAASYVRASRLPLAAMVATNGWYAVTVDGPLPLEDAREMLARLKRYRIVPEDSFITYGNIYVRRVCCD